MSAFFYDLKPLPLTFFRAFHFMQFFIADSESKTSDAIFAFDPKGKFQFLILKFFIFRKKLKSFSNFEKFENFEIFPENLENRFSLKFH